MLEVDDSDIYALHDEVLRELVGRLCEAELESLGLSPSAVHWGGDHKAADGGLDVSVSLPNSVHITGFIPRPVTGFQVKTPTMSAAAIRKEMAPRSSARPAIRALALNGGAYIMVSAKSSNTSSALASRRKAMVEALRNVRGRGQLITDFYERGKLSTWIRRHAGVALWLASKIGKAYVGWRPHGAWAVRPTAADPGFLMNKAPRVYCSLRPEELLPDAEALDVVRAQLTAPGAVVRLVGLSGVGKTRFAEQLFDARKHPKALPASQVFYADMSDSPEPPPIGMAERLLALGKPAFLVVDNCPPDLHRSLSNVCRRGTSQLRVLTIEYDIRDDQPEGTEVVRLEPNTDSTIEKLLSARFQCLSALDVATISKFSGGNARLAIVAAEAWSRHGGGVRIGDAELFRRIFFQRNPEDDSLRQVAQAAALVYSFSIDATGPGEARCLARLCRADETEFIRRVEQLRERGVVQARGEWRAVLPHVIANRLAEEALRSWSRAAIEAVVVDPVNPRLLRSFSRRLGFLHRSDEAVAIVDAWLSPGGLLGETETLDEARAEVFANVAPVSQWKALTALERVGQRHASAGASAVWASHAELLRHLAYNAEMFTQAARMLASGALEAPSVEARVGARRALVSLFYAALSGTHAPLDRRLAVVQSVVVRLEEGATGLAIECLNAALECDHFSSSYRFDFGATSRDHGYRPRTRDEATQWLSAVLTKARSWAANPDLRLALRPSVAARFGPLWRFGGIESEIEALVMALAEGSYWPEGWKACRRTAVSRSESLGRNSRRRLLALERALAPTNIGDRVRAFLVGDYLLDVLDESNGENAIQRASKRRANIAAEIGAELMEDSSTFKDMLPMLLRHDNRAMDLGHGMASKSLDPEALWTMFVDGLSEIAVDERKYALPMGLLRWLAGCDRPLAEQLLDRCVAHPVMGAVFPECQAVVGVLSKDVSRILRAITLKLSPVQKYISLAYGVAIDGCGAAELKDLLIRLASEPGGYDAALEILWMRLGPARGEADALAAEIVEAGQSLLQRLEFDSGGARDREYKAIQVIERCVIGRSAAGVAAEVARKVREAMVDHSLWPFNAKCVIKPLLMKEPIVVLDVLLGGSAEDMIALIRLWDDFSDRDQDPWGAVPKETWREWCDRDPESRYPRAASVVQLIQAGAEGGVGWSDIALQLLAEAQNPGEVLGVMVERFTPMIWSGSRAAIMERYLKLLESLDRGVVAKIPDLVERYRESLRLEIVWQRRLEKEGSRNVDESFE